ncbi:hypothetical protein [Streptomyces phytophilus]|uniref:hypothetical protein n=1 Tax=Streptomyces phytophilus TaxID=722715 RepID=UPI0015F11583|nr:hypothetical protein [Streptomyces phytophilus]
MRTLKPVLAAAAFSAAAVGVMIPAGSASADPVAARTEVRDVSAQELNCDETKARYGSTGKVYMYNGTNCAGSAMCKDYNNDSNYASGGSCTGSDNNATSSVLNLGWNTSGPDDVRLYTKTGYNGDNIGCVFRGTAWHDVGAAHGWKDNTASSHRWESC